MLCQEHRGGDLYRSRSHPSCSSNLIRALSWWKQTFSNTPSEAGGATLKMTAALLGKLEHLHARYTRLVTQVNEGSACTNEEYKLLQQEIHELHPIATSLERYKHLKHEVFVNLEVGVYEAIISCVHGLSYGCFLDPCVTEHVHTAQGPAKVKHARATSQKEVKHDSVVIFKLYRSNFWCPDKDLSAGSMPPAVPMPEGCQSVCLAARACHELVEAPAPARTFERIYHGMAWT
jgi:hypothetical protein